ncbi:hypothetical protein N7456_004171 [Penicillium angulare]|uniref:Aflatoxin regulatory protein domain-containing protein n=1 Tax=Penicillium angulare TaxID=116970 RepID=A0A9W9FW30_9EURO|nr:hypothetical protein N7456_004171 [Penicillium angulare]
MVGRAPKKRRTKANDQIPYQQEPQPPLDMNLQQTDRDNGPYPHSLVGISSMPGTTTTAGNRDVTLDGAGFAIEDFNAIAAEMETNNYLQNLLSDYPDLPLVSPAPTDPFFLATENILPDPHADMNGTSNSENTFSTPRHLQHSLASSNTSVISDKHTPNSLPQEPIAENLRSRLAEQTEARVPSSYRDQSVVSNYPNTAALMKMIEYLEEQLQIPRVPIDQAMRLNRQAMKRIRDVSKTEDFQRCQSCPLLVATVMDLVVGLYELVILSVQHPASEADDSLSPDQNGVLSRKSPIQQPDIEMQGSESTPETTFSGDLQAPLFRFGCLEFDPEEQEIFRAAMIRRDLRRCVETIQFCNHEVMKQRQAARSRGTPGKEPSPSSRESNEHVHTQWYQEMAYRVKELLNGLPAQCSHK